MKILILTKGLDEIETTTLKQGMDMIKNLLPNLDFTYQQTDANFNSIQFSNDVASGYLLDNTQILPLVNGNYDIACLFFDATLVFPNPTNPSTSLIKKGNCIPMAIPKQWYNGYVDVLIQFFLHELSHAEHFRYGAKDLTHDFYSSNFVQVPGTGLRDYYLFLLKKLWTANAPIVPPTLPVVTLTRLSDDGLQTIGTLSFGAFTCDTLERPWKNNTYNISCIPKGSYTARYTFSWRFLKSTYELQNTSPRSGIRIHSANLYSQLLGCIALGRTFQDINGDKEVDIINSRVTIQAFEQLMGKKDFTLIIQ